MPATNETIDAVEKATKDYKYGFVTEIEMELAPKGLNEDIVKFISGKNEEPAWLLEWRLDSYKKWLKMVSMTRQKSIFLLMMMNMRMKKYVDLFTTVSTIHPIKTDYSTEGSTLKVVRRLQDLGCDYA